MQFWSGTPFLRTTVCLELVPLLDEAGYDGVVTADHLIYPRGIASPYPDGADVPSWQPETEWPDSWVTIDAMPPRPLGCASPTPVYVAAVARGDYRIPSAESGADHVRR